MAQELMWLDHVGSIKDGIELINELGWNITIQNGFVLAGDQAIFKSDSKDAIDAFIYGMALAYSVIPEDIFGILKKQSEEDE